MVWHACHNESASMPSSNNNCASIKALLPIDGCTLFLLLIDHRSFTSSSSYYINDHRASDIAWKELVDCWSSFISWCVFLVGNKAYGTGWRVHLYGMKGGFGVTQPLRNLAHPLFSTA